MTGRLTSSSLIFPYAATILLLAGLLGGGTRQGLNGDFIVQLAALPLLVLSLSRLRSMRLNGSRQFALLLLMLIAGLMVAQLVPLPPDIWTQLPGRSELASALQVAGVPIGWAPVSMDPYATEQTLWGLVPPFSLFLATLSLSGSHRQKLAMGVLALAAVNIILGFAQVANGPESALRFYRPTNVQNTVGFFANRNHYASLLAVSIPLCAAWLHHALRQQGTAGNAAGKVLAAATLLVLLILALIMAGSRAGLFLGVLALVGSFFIIRRQPTKSRLVKWGFGGAVFLGVLFGAQYGLQEILAKFDSDLQEDLRWTAFENTSSAAGEYSPVGSGFGTFEDLYQLHEKPTDLKHVFVNHAHNDYLELWLEGGWSALLLVMLFLLWVSYSFVRIWRQSGSGWASYAMERASAIGIVLLLLHEAVDYPLRTTANATVFAVLCALLIGRNADFKKRRRVEAPA